MKSKQRRLDEEYYARPTIDVEIPSRADWENKIHNLERWIRKESVYAKRVLRLRSYLYLKQNMVRFHHRKRTYVTTEEGLRIQQQLPHD